ncbi:uncharacterized protein LOC131653180 [Vicia villosa]|uniref:uncharacterized protein LOC131653180 n=2 Tax=Vicia villosa TaxID=3911 RepID=UPI00273AF6BF|nr:uncharacterized protein LOC131653180 [Vicia villosa]
MVSETTLLRDAIGSFVAWPSELITISDETAPIKPTVKGKGILQEEESVASLKEASARESQQVTQQVRTVPPTGPPKPAGKKGGAFVPRYRSTLATMVDMSDLKDGALREIVMDESVFGIEFKSLITIDDLEEIFKHDQLGVTNMHSYIRLLYDRVLRGTPLSNRFRFVSSAHCSGMAIASEPESVRQRLVDRFMSTGNTESLHLWAYNTRPVGAHWLLLAINPIREVVYYLNSVNGEWTNYQAMKDIVDLSIQVFRSQRDAQVSRTKSNNITWIQVQCPQQRNSYDCGYFVLRYMKEILQANQLEIPLTYLDEFRATAYPKLKLEEIKEDLCQFYIQRFFM